MTTQILAASALMLGSVTAQAVDLSFNFVEVEPFVSTATVEGSAAPIDAIGLRTRVNAMLGAESTWLLDLDLQYHNFEESPLDQSTMRLGFAKRILINEDERNPSATALSVSYIRRADADNSNQDGLSLAIEYRVNTDVNIEFGGGLRVNNFPDYEEFIVNLRLMYHFTDLFAMYGSYERVDTEFDSGAETVDGNQTGLGIRFEF